MNVYHKLLINLNQCSPAGIWRPFLDSRCMKLTEIYFQCKIWHPLEIDGNSIFLRSAHSRSLVITLSSNWILLICFRSYRLFPSQLALLVARNYSKFSLAPCDMFSLWLGLVITLVLILRHSTLVRSMSEVVPWVVIHSFLPGERKEDIFLKQA